MEGAGRDGQEFNPGAMIGASTLGFVTGGVGGYAGKMFVGFAITRTMNRAYSGIGGGLAGAEGAFVGSLIGGGPPDRAEGNGGPRPHVKE